MCSSDLAAGRRRLEERIEAAQRDGEGPNLTPRWVSYQIGQTLGQEAMILHELTDSSFYLGLMAFLADLPIILFSLVGGVIADRADRRKLLLGSQYTQMLSALILTALVWQDVVNIWHILALVFISGVGQSFCGPAYSALIPGLVKKEEVPNAIALNSIQFNLAQMVGPMISAPVMALGGAALAFGLNGLSFFAVVVSLYMIRATFVPKKTDRKSTRLNSSH